MIQAPRSAEHAANEYGTRGLCVHPLRPGSKLPLLNRWPERATNDRASVAAFWRQWPDAGVAIATGAASGVIVLDVDPRHGGDDSLVELEHHYGELPPSWRCLTASGGLHVYFKHPGGHVGNRAGLWPGIDVRGDGGYVVAPPTDLAPGRGYEWEIGYAPGELPLAPPPGWLLGRITRKDCAAGRTPEWWRTLVRDGVDQGARNDAVARLAGHLLRRGVDPFVTLDLAFCWNEARCRPSLSRDEVARTVESIARRELERRRLTA